MSASYRIFNVTLKHKEHISPSLLRCIFTGPEVDRMKLEAPDQRIKLLFRNEDGQLRQLENSDDWYRNYMVIPKKQRPVMRTYTLRALRSEQREVDVEFVLHGVKGPASAWVTHANPGDPIQMVAPNADFKGKSGGYEWMPSAQVKKILLIADETAVPAVMGILEQLSLQVNPPPVQAFFEVPMAKDCINVAQFSFAEVYWLPRDISQQQRHGTLLVEAVRQHVDISDVACTDTPALAERSQNGDLLWERAESTTDFYAWVAAECSTVKMLRHYLLSECKLDRLTINFMAYWCKF